MNISAMLDSNESSLELDQEQPMNVVTSVASSSTISSSCSSSSSSASSTSSTSSVDLDIIAKPPQDSAYDGSKLAAGPDEAIKHFPSRNPSPAIPTIPAAAAATPAQPAHGPPVHIDPELEVDNTQPNVDIVVGDYVLGDYSRFPSSSPTAVEDTSFDGERKRFSSLERENGRAYPHLDALFNAREDEDDTKDVNDDSNIPVPNFDDTDESFVPRSNNTSNTSISTNDKEEVKDDEPPAKRETRSKKKSLAADTSVGDIVGTRTSSRIRASAGSQGGSTRISEGHVFDSLKDFFELASPRFRENNHHMDIYVQERFNKDVGLSLASASMDCADKKTPKIRCGSTVVAVQKVDEELHDRMRGKKGYRPKLFWRITVYQPEHCVDCIVKASSLPKEQVEANEQEWLDRKNYYQNGNKVSTPSAGETDDEEDDEEEDTRGRAPSRGLRRRSANGRDRKRTQQASARRNSSRHPSTSRAPSSNENEEGGSDMDMSDNEQENMTDAESDASDDIITVSASFTAPRLSQVKKEGTPYAQSARSSSSQPRAKVYRETKPLGPIPGHEHRNSASKNKNKTSTKAFYGNASSAASSSKQTKMKPPAGVLRDHAKQAVRNQREKSVTAARSASSSTIGLRKRAHEESETTDTPEPPEEVPYRPERFPRIGSFGLMSPGPLPPSHLSQAPRLSASPAKRFKANRETSSPKMKVSAETPISAFKLLPIALEVIEKAEIKTLGDFLVNGTSSSDLFRWFLTYYCYTKFGMEACSNTQQGDAGGELVKGAEMMQFLAASRLLGPALDQLEEEADED